MAISPRLATRIRSKPLIYPPVPPTVGFGPSTRMSYPVEAISAGAGAPLFASISRSTAPAASTKRAMVSARKAPMQPDAKALHLRELAGIDHKPTFREPVVERLEAPGRIGRRTRNVTMIGACTASPSSVSKPRPRIPSTNVRQFSQ